MLYCVELETRPETEASFPCLKVYSCRVFLSRKLKKGGGEGTGGGGAVISTGREENFRTIPFLLSMLGTLIFSWQKGA